MCAVKFYSRHKKETDAVRIDYHIDALERKLFWLIVLMAFLVRIIGVNWGAGQTFHPDEGKVVRPPISMAENCTFMSDELEAPSQITSRVLSVIFKLVMIVSGISGSEIGNLTYVIITRAYMAVLSAGVVACVFLIGNYLKKHAGTVAAVLTAFFPPFIHAAHCAVNDTFVGLCICACILCAFHYLEENRDYKWLAAMSVITLLALYDKWHGIVACAIIAIAVCIKQIKHKRYANIIKQGAFAVAVIIGVAALTAPNLVTNIQDIAKTLTHLTNDYATENSATFGENLYTYVLWFFSHMGIISSIFVIAGFICGIKEKRIEYMLLLIGMIEIIGICLQDRHFIRWGYPFYVCLIIMVGAGVVYAYERIYIQNKRVLKTVSRTVFVCCITLTVLNLLAGTVLLDVMYSNSQLDTRIVSEKWCLDRGIAQFDCVYDSYTCWEPGGIVIRYPYRARDEISIGATVENIDGDIVVNRIGRSYAVAHPDENTKLLIEQGGGIEAAYFRADCVFNDNGFGDFGYVPYKILEPSRILFCMNKCIGILQKNMSFGRDDIVIYDISMIPAYEKCEYIDYDSEADLYWGRIDKIPQGTLKVEVSGEGIENGQVFIENADGVVVSTFDFIDGHAEFVMDKDCYLLTVKTDQKFDYIKFVPDL
ncbi:MAG: glycosyltransferase family 39 protein [Lachnospiraceae bacterium]|nr:glycosyltransferase family 39 protein [Lachnospiraceae bacterium]